MDDRAEWEKRQPPKTGLSAERDEWIQRILDRLHGREGLEAVLEAFDMQHEWLQRHPGDITMKSFGSSLARSWCWRGGDLEDLKQKLGERRARQARQDAA